MGEEKLFSYFKEQNTVPEDKFEELSVAHDFGRFVYEDRVIYRTVGQSDFKEGEYSIYTVIFGYDEHDNETLALRRDVWKKDGEVVRVSCEKVFGDTYIDIDDEEDEEEEDFEY